MVYFFTKCRLKFIAGIVLLCCFCLKIQAQSSLVELRSDSILLIGKQVQVLQDETQALTISGVLASGNFVPSTLAVLNSYSAKGNLWVKFMAANRSAISDFVLNINYPLLTKATLYKLAGGKIVNEQGDGFALPFNNKKYKFQNFIFDLNLKPGDTATYLLKVYSDVPVILPLEIGTVAEIENLSVQKDIFTSIYAGIIISLFLYNIFIYFSVKDRSYIYYVGYIIFFGLTQLLLQGYCWRLFWPGHPQINSYAVIISAAITGLTALNFVRRFLEVKTVLPWANTWFNIFSVVYLLAIISVVVGQYGIAFRIIDANVSVLVLFCLVISIIIARSGSSSAVFFLISWSVFILAMIIFVLRNLGVYPYNGFSNYVLYIGSSIETILLSIALANRINIYKKEKEKSQAEALQASLENEKLVRDQNIVLEKKVVERTEELVNTNHQLNDALVSLKDAQTQLVDAEKMASLGQLTAGIAHEINNPINFVKSNISPLKLDIKDIFDVVDEYNNLHTLTGDINSYKKQLQQIDAFKKQIDIDFIKDEVQHLIKGIEDGAERTAEIVRGLRTFSRLDESELKVVNIHDGIDSTIVLIRNTIPLDVHVIKHFNAKGAVECYPGKLNQVFMNIITNGLQAISAKQQRTANESITITTNDNIDNTWITICIKDTGIGMSEEVKHRVFEPFFTTKDVGEGTGLGMAIVFKIIEKHFGKIEINSSPGNGAEFIITLPYVQPIT